MKKIKVLKNLVLLIIVALLFLLTIYYLPGNQEEPEFVTGNKHIYKNQLLVPDYKPNLFRLSMRASWLDSNQKIDGEAKQALEDMVLDAERDGVCLVVTSGYRSAEKQQELYNAAKDKNLVALPNASEHQTGLAVDFAACPMENGKRNDEIERLELKNPFNTLPEYQWLRENAVKYSFEESFTEENKKETGFPAEPWHWKYIIK